MTLPRVDASNHRFSALYWEYIVANDQSSAARFCRSANYAIALW